VASASPLDAVVSDLRGPNGLRAELFGGGASVSGDVASQLSAGARAEPVLEELTGAAGARTEPGGAAPAVEGGQPGARVLVVDPEGEGDVTLRSLSAACAVARQGDVIELRYTGRLEEEPLELANLEVTICAAEGFQPVVGFRPSEIDPIGYPRSMITLIGSRLTLVGVQIDLDLSRELPSDRWTLFDVGQGEGVKLDGCWLTLRNAADHRGAYHAEVAFFRLKASPGRSLAIDDGAREPAQGVAIELADCVVRGEGALVWTEDLRPVRLDWTGGFLATTEQLLVAEAGETSPQPGERIEVNLSGLTAVADGGLCKLEQSELAPYQLPARFDCANSFFLLRPGASLIEQVGVSDMEHSSELVFWDGENNVYQGFTDFWTVRHLGPAIVPPPMTFDDWRARWDESTSQLGRIAEEELPPADRPVHELTPDDYPRVRLTPEAPP
jgi:hypothetical protein